MSGFFVPGIVYVQDEPFRAPELLEVFQCVAVATHPAKGELRAFGFLATAYPGDNWASHALRSGDWENGWIEAPSTSAAVELGIEA
jgi:hypothetical protein